MQVIWFFVIITSVGSINPVMQDAIFYDEYGDENPGVISAGGHILVICKISDCYNDGAHVQLVYSTTGTLLDSTSCAEQVILRLNISRSALFGEYRCKYANQMSEKPFDYRHRMCSPHDSACTQSCDHGKSNLCVVRSDNMSRACITSPDDDFPEAYCKPQLERNSTTGKIHVVYCGAETEGVEQPRSMCEGYAKGLWTKISTRVFDSNVTAMCQMHDWDTFIPADESNSRDPRVGAYPVVRNFMRPSEARMYNGVYSVQKDETMMIKVPYHYIAYNATINCTLKAPNGTIISWNSIQIIGNTRIFFIKPFNITAFDVKFGIFAFKFACAFRNGDGMLLADTAFYAYYKARAEGYATIDMNKNPDGLGTRSITCKPALDLPPQYALGRYVWHLRNYALHNDEMELDTNTSTYILKENGTYKCYIGVYIKCKEGDEEYDSVLLSHEIEVYDVLGRGTTTSTEHLPASAAECWMTSSPTKVIFVLLEAAIGILSFHE